MPDGFWWRAALLLFVALVLVALATFAFSKAKYGG